jgi:light-regulated signal transduction histidine kinase (bacteriophytochrome)
MKVSMSRMEDSETLQDLGRASIQIVHDLKNQLNGLKLYATFLRRRLEKSERPEDEQETIAKLMAGLDRAANDLATIVEYGRQIELKKQPGFEVQKVLRTVCSSFDGPKAQIVVDPSSDSVQGNFDPLKLTDAFKWISSAAIKNRRNDEKAEAIPVSVKVAAVNNTEAIIEWSGLRKIDHDPFHAFKGSEEIRLALAAKIIEAHDGSAKLAEDRFVVRLPLSGQPPTNSSSL